MIVYKLTSPSGKVYIGQTSRDLNIRIKEHHGGRNSKNPKVIGHAFAKYPNLEEWDISILQECSSREELNEAEIYWIEFFDSYNNGYNMNRGGAAITSGPMREEHRKAISEARTKFYNTEIGISWRETLSRKWKENNPCKPGNIPWNNNIKDCFTEQSRKQMSESQRKRYDDLEERVKASERIKNLWERGVFDNRPPHSEDHRRKISESLKGHPAYDNQRKRASEANKGVPKSEEHKRKISEKAKGRVYPKLECPHCKFIGGGGRMLSNHFDNCKSKN